MIKYCKFLRENTGERKKRKPSWESEYTREDIGYYKQRGLRKEFGEPMPK